MSLLVNFFRKLRLNTKIFLVSAGLAAIFLGTSVYLIINSVYDTFIDISVEKTKEDIEFHSKILELELDLLKGNVKTLSGTPPIQGLFRAIDNDGYDKIGNSTYEQWIDMLTTIFYEEVENQDYYYHLRYLDIDGNEIVRVNRDDRFVYIVSKDELQNKKDRGYFKDALSSDANDILSDASLNREGANSELEKPYVPVVRYTVPVFDQVSGEKRGFVIANLLLSRMLNQAEINSDDDDIMLFDDNFNYIHHFNSKKEWGGVNDLNTGENFLKDYPNLSLKDFSKDGGIIYSGYNIFVFDKLAIGPNRYWILVEKLNVNVLGSTISNLMKINTLFAAGFFIALGFVFIFATGRILKPLKDLIAGVNKIRSKDFSFRININNKDELGTLADAFNGMSQDLGSLYKDLESKIAEKTKLLSSRVGELEDAKKATINVLEDIELEKEKISKERDRINTILESIGDAVFVVSRDLDIVLANRPVSDVSGFSNEELVGKKYNTILRFINEKDKKVVSSFIDDVIKTGETKEEIDNKDIVLVNKNGNEVAVSVSSAPVKGKDGGVAGVVVVFRDASKERAVDRSKTEFVSLASHQLRTPLSAINWYAEMLLEGDAGTITPEQKKYIEEIYKGNQRMVELISALLNVSRIDLGTFMIEPEPVKLEEIAKSVIQELDHMIEQKKIKLTEEYGELPEIQADRKLTRIIFQNLLSNSVKYTPEGGNIGLSIKKVEKDEEFGKTKATTEYIGIKISDTGYGIPKDQQAKIFDKLFRADNVKIKDTEGTGLGLYLVKSIIDETGGHIWFESEEDKGTTFYIKLPIEGMKKKEGTRKLE